MATGDWAQERYRNMAARGIMSHTSYLIVERGFTNKAIFSRPAYNGNLYRPACMCGYRSALTFRYFDIATDALRHHQNGGYM